MIDNKPFLFSSADYLPFRNTLNGLYVTDIEECLTLSEYNLYYYYGVWQPNANEIKCPRCDSHGHIHNGHDTVIKHIPIASTFTSVNFNISQYKCPNCGITYTPQPSFKHPNHRITMQLYNYIEQQLALNLYTLKDISNRTGVCVKTVKEIDKKRLLKKYTIDGKTLKPPDKQARYIGIDEFKLHNNHKYATHIIDLETGDVLYISHGKKKKVVYDFIALVGDVYMKNIVAMACDMNSDFYEAINEKYPHIEVVFDYFHIVRIFNDKVVSEVRKDEVKRLQSEGKFDEARRLKGTKHILTSSRATLEKKDDDREKAKVIHKGSKLFNTDDIVRDKEYMRTYDLLLLENHLFLKIDLIKDYLKSAFEAKDINDMEDCLNQIVHICNESDNEHFEWFSKLLTSHWKGIVNHAMYNISNGKIEGMNNKIKTLRRLGYGYPDDEYFFLKIIDMSRIKNIKNVKSHKKS